MSDFIASFHREREGFSSDDATSGGRLLSGPTNDFVKADRIFRSGAGAGSLRRSDVERYRVELFFRAADALAQRQVAWVLDDVVEQRVTREVDQARVLVLDRLVEPL